MAERPLRRSGCGRRVRGTLPLAVLLVAVLMGTEVVGPATRPVGAAPPPTLTITNVAPPSAGVVPTGGITVRALVAGDLAPGSATVTLDGAPLDTAVRPAGSASVVSATGTLAAAGLHRARVSAEVGGRRVERSWSFLASPVAVRRLAGANRVETAAAVAVDILDGTRASAAVLARADRFPDALAGVSLAAVLGAPLLLTGPSGLDAVTARTLRDHVRPEGTVHLLGGPAALAPGVAGAVEALGLRARRLAGATRYETAAAVADELVRVRGEPPTGVVLASGEAFADALTGSVPAAMRGWPVLLTPSDELADVTGRWLAAQASTGLQRVEVVGGPAAVAEEVAVAATRVAGEVTMRRTGGEDRYDTATLVADRFFGETDALALANGRDFPDGLSGGVLAAVREMPLLLTSMRLPEGPTRRMAAGAVADLVVFGGPNAVGERAVTDALRAAAGKGTAAMAPPAGTRMTVTTDELPDPLTLQASTTLATDSTASLDVGGDEAGASVSVAGDTLTVRVTALPSGLPVDVDVPVRLRALLRLTSGGTTAVDADLRLRLMHPVVRTSEGFVALGGHGRVVGSQGTLRTYSLEVEPETGIGVREFAREAEAILSDRRSWSAGSDVRLQRVPPGEAQIRVVLAQPATVDGLCARAGLDTGGYLSCWNGRFAALNVDRWRSGADRFTGSLSVYRGYLVNHEVGHGLGHRHRGCPAAGAPAPVMMQQSKGLDGCVANAWPYP